MMTAIVSGCSVRGIFVVRRKCRRRYLRSGTGQVLEIGLGIEAD
jgi:hypothetical protein